MNPISPEVNGLQKVEKAELISLRYQFEISNGPRSPRFETCNKPDGGRFMLVPPSIWGMSVKQLKAVGGINARANWYRSSKLLLLRFLFAFFALFATV